MREDLAPINNPIDALRLEFGDVDEFDEFLSDQSYQYFINNYGNSPRKLRTTIGNAILANLAINGFRQRVGQEDAYLGERFNNYMKWLKGKLTNPMLSGNMPNVYVGGVVRETVAEYELRRDLIHSTFYLGQSSGIPNWKSYREYYPDHTREQEERTDYFVER